MYKIGVCSVTFRRLSAEGVIDLAKAADIDGIEWGGDVHVPPGDFERAQEIAKLSEKANLQIVSYGSYYKIGHNHDSAPFDKILSTAIRLKAPSIRVWAGELGSREANSVYRDNVIKDARIIAEKALAHKIAVHLEFHGGTLTDTAESAKLLIHEINHSNIHLYWQPPIGLSVEKRLDSINKVSPWLSHIHVFHWIGTDRYPLKDGRDEWNQYLSKLRTLQSTRYLLLEFVKENKKDQFMEDVETLKKLMREFK